MREILQRPHAGRVKGAAENESFQEGRFLSNPHPILYASFPQTPGKGLGVTTRPWGGDQRSSFIQPGIN
jgi:hypothetical protein